jgi:hypothetical protein
VIGRGNVIDGRFRLANHVSELLVAGGSSVKSYILTIAAAGKDGESDSIVCGLGRQTLLNIWRCMVSVSDECEEGLV